MNGNGSGAATPFINASSNAINTTSSKFDLLGSKTSKKQPNNDSVEQPTNDDDKSNGNKQDSSAEDNWSCSKCNNNNPSSKIRCRSCLAWKDDQRRQLTSPSFLQTRKKSKLLHDTLSTCGGSGSASFNNEGLGYNNNVMGGGGSDSSGAVTTTTLSTNALCFDSGASQNNNPYHQEGISHNWRRILLNNNFVRDNDFEDTSRMPYGSRKKVRDEIQLWSSPSVGGGGGSAKLILGESPMNAAVSTRSPLTSNESRARAPFSPRNLLDSITHTNNHSSPQIDGKENAGHLKVDEHEDDNNNELNEEEDSGDDYLGELDEFKGKGDGGALSHFDVLLEDGLIFSPDSEEITHGQPNTYHTAPSVSIGTANFNRLDTIDRKKVKGYDPDYATYVKYGIEAPENYAPLLPAGADRTCRRTLMTHRCALLAQFGNMKPSDIPIEDRWWDVLNVSKELFEFQCLRCGSMARLKNLKANNLKPHHQSCSRSLEPEVCEHCGLDNVQLELEKGNQMSQHKVACRNTAEMREEFEKKFPLLQMFYADNGIGPEAGGVINISYSKVGVPVNGRTYRRKKGSGGWEVTWKYGDGKGESIKLKHLYDWARNRTLGRSSSDNSRKMEFLPPGDMRDRMIRLGFTKERGFFGGV